MVRLLRMHFCRVQLLPGPISLAPVLLQPSLAYLAAATSKAELRLCEPSLGVTTDPATPRTWTSRAAITIELLAGLCSLKAQIGGARVSRTMAVPDKVALGLFFFWWHGSSVRALPSSIPRMPLLLHRVLTRAPTRGAEARRDTAIKCKNTGMPATPSTTSTTRARSTPSAARRPA